MFPVEDDSALGAEVCNNDCDDDKASDDPNAGEVEEDNDDVGADAANEEFVKSLASRAGIDSVRCSLLSQDSYLVPMVLLLLPALRCSVGGVAGVLNEFHDKVPE